jgi:mutator protein MutT
VVSALRPRVIVCAAVIEHAGRFLVTRRQRGVHLEGYWEFPGGKCETGEPLDECLRREIREELGTDAAVGLELLTVAHEYAERTVELHFLSCTLSAAPTPLLGQEMRWVDRTELRTLEFPPADEEFIALLERGK